MEPLIEFVIWAIVAGFIAWVLLVILDRVPLEATYKQIAKGAVVVIAVIILLVKLIPVVSGLL